MNKIETEITRLQKEHAHDTYKYRADPSLWRFMKDDTCSDGDLTMEEAAYARFIEDDSQRCFAILYDSKCVGVVKVKNLYGNGTGELSYYLLRQELRNKGITSSAVRQAINYSFDELFLDVLYLYINPRNVSSYALAIRLGFYPVGIGLTNDNVQRLELTRTVWKNMNRKN